MSSESDFLEWVRTRQQSDRRVLLPAGDDLAVLRWDSRDLLLVGVDQVLDGVHFDSRVHSPELIGRKAMNRNLSDCAAMGCLPVAALVSAAVPQSSSLDYLKALYDGMRAAGAVFDCAIVGGDTGSWAGQLALSVSVFGSSAGVQPITRSGARPGDGIYVTGPLGGSILGRHLTFEPRVAVGRELASSGVVTAMLDSSDGLSRDLPRITQGVVIDAAAVPIHPDASVDRQDGRTPLQHALHDGEDYELLFTASATPPHGIHIGSVSKSPGYWLKHTDGTLEPLTPLGWDHKLAPSI